MRAIHLLLAASLLAHVSSHAGSLEGTWFACNPEITTPTPRNILFIERKGGSYHWQHAWGQYESAEGHLQVLSKQIVFFGCRSYRGEVEATCDMEKPPEIMRIDLKDLSRKHRSLDAALLGGAWIRVGRFTQAELDHRCEEAQAELASKQTP